MIFCDDDPMAHQSSSCHMCQSFCTAGRKESGIAYYSSGDALLNAKVRADIAFLDVEMPGVSIPRVAQS